MLHKNVLIKARVRELEKQIAELTRRKGRKRKRIQTGGTIEFSIGASQVAESASTARTISKKARSSSNQERALPGQRRCSNCGKTGHNARTCQKDAAEDSESNAVTSYEGSIASVE
jgi:hypothetical protein